MHLKHALFQQKAEKLRFLFAVLVDVVGKVDVLLGMDCSVCTRSASVTSIVSSSTKEGGFEVCDGG